MTGFDIYSTAQATMFVDTGKNVADERFTVRHLNTVLQELLPLENNLREAEGMELLPAAPIIQSLDVEIPYRDSITRGCIPYALAALYQQDELDNYQAERYHNLYLMACENAKKGIWVNV